MRLACQPTALTSYLIEPLHEKDGDGVPPTGPCTFDPHGQGLTTVLVVGGTSAPSAPAERPAPVDTSESSSNAGGASSPPSSSSDRLSRPSLPKITPAQLPGTDFTRCFVDGVRVLLADDMMMNQQLLQVRNDRATSPFSQLSRLSPFSRLSADFPPQFQVSMARVNPSWKIQLAMSGDGAELKPFLDPTSPI